MFSMYLQGNRRWVPLLNNIQARFNQTVDTPFSPHGDKLALANDMGSFFIKKISDLRVSLDAK